jgi:prepilin-type N-terminal cleavage/methylation domain-containing protein
MGRKGFTLIELLVVIAIIAILVALFTPVFVAAKHAVKQSVAVSAGRQLHMATELYMGDNSDVFPLGMYLTDTYAWQTWFGLQVKKDEFDPARGIIGAYRGNKVAKDPAHTARPYLGDFSGFGYNYGYIGGDFHVTGDFTHFPYCERPASSSELGSPSTTIVYASSAFFNAPWLPNGDGMVYDFGFIDPPEAWNGNPNVDFRHFGKRLVDFDSKEVDNEDGRAVVVFADGRVKPYKKHQLEAAWFRRAQNAN